MDEDEYKKTISKLKKSELLEKFLALRKHRSVEIQAIQKREKGMREALKNYHKAYSNNDSPIIDNIFSLELGKKLFVKAEDKTYSGFLRKETKDFLIIKTGEGEKVYEYIVRKNQILGCKVYYEGEY